MPRAVDRIQKPDSPLALWSFVASERGFLATSQIVLGREECVIVDAQLLQSEARSLVDLIRSSGRRLAQVYVTHGHPDHYFGAEVLRDAFPGLDVVALPAVVEVIAASYRDKIAYWKPTFGSDVPSEVRLPRALTEPGLMLEGTLLPISVLGAAESEADTVVLVPPLSALLAGDLVYNRGHSWLRERRADAWLEALGILRERFSVRHVLPGHGRRGDAALFDATADYVEAFREVATHARGIDEARAQLLARYPDYALRPFLDISLEAWMAPT